MIQSSLEEIRIEVNYILLEFGLHTLMTGGTICKI